MKKIILLILCMIMAVTGTFTAMAAGPGEQNYADYFDPEQFVLPEDAKVLVVVGGMEETRCKAYVFERTDTGNGKKWNCITETNGHMGRNGMSNDRHEGDGTTPIGVWQMNTPFGQKSAEEGFPANYIQVSGNDYVWTETTNKLEVDPTGLVAGERVGSDKYKGYYDYAIDAGYNRNAIPGKGSALFLHCLKPEEGGSSGCIKISEDKMKMIMKLYGKYGDGKCYIAQAPIKAIPQLYNAYGANNGLSPQGKF